MLLDVCCPCPFPPRLPPVGSVFGAAVLSATEALLVAPVVLAPVVLAMALKGWPTVVLNSSCLGCVWLALCAHRAGLLPSGWCLLSASCCCLCCLAPFPVCEGGSGLAFSTALCSGVLSHLCPSPCGCCLHRPALQLCVCCPRCGCTLGLLEGLPCRLCSFSGHLRCIFRPRSPVLCWSRLLWEHSLGSCCSLGLQSWKSLCTTSTDPAGLPSCPPLPGGPV